MPRRPAVPVAWEPRTNPAAVAVFTTVLAGGPVSRADIARRTGLSPAAVTKAVRPFLDAGYLAEGDGAVPSGTPGRPSSPLVVGADREYFAGVKVTEDELVAVIVDLKGVVRDVARRRRRAASPAGVVGEIGRLVGRLRDRDPAYGERCHSIGVAVSGDVDRAGGRVRWSPILGWREFDLAAGVARATGLTAVVENDVKALATGEWLFGVAAGTDPVALVAVGAGVGSALVVDGRPLAGAYGVAGEIGHVPVGGAEDVCSCGGRGCVEAIASHPAIVRAVRAATGRDDLDVAGAVALARAGDRAARRVFERAGHALGLAVAALVNLTGPRRVIVTGEGLAAYDLFGEQVRTTYAAQAFGAAGSCPVDVRPLTFEDWARGAAVVSLQALFDPDG